MDIKNNKNIQHKILIVDDSEMNRDMLMEILENEYSVMQAENGARALEILEKKRNDFSCVLLDLNMIVLDGYAVLEHMKKNNWLNSLPVIIISSEEKPEIIRRAFRLGAIDFITRPFDYEIVQHRVYNTIQVYAKQKKLAKMVVDQLYENDRINNVMLSLFGQIVEFRNRESGPHIENVSLLTEIFLEELQKKTTQYKLSQNDIKLIIRASTLHDIGKISIPESILNKPGKLTQEEFEEIKKHSAYGSEMLKNCKQFNEEPILQIAYRICRWHHERYDGKGYPDGIAGDNIPIEAQVVALADVYDALTSIRCYKGAYSHDQAITMIINGQCGNFNPILLRILKDVSSTLPDRVSMTLLKRENLSKRK